MLARGLRRSFWVGLVLAGLTANAAQASTAAPGYLSDDFHALALASNQFMSGAKLVDASSPVQLFPKAQPESGGPIWTFRCPAAAESVTFSRSIGLPGPPNYAGSFTYGTDVGRRELGSLTSIELIVNGDTIVSEPLRAYTVGPQGTAARVPLDATAQKAFHFGANTVQVRVTKRATHGGCNKANPATRVGVWFTLAGQFETDLALNPPSPDQFIALAPGATDTQPLSVNFHNLGPAWEPNGSFFLSIAGAPTAALGSGLGAPAPSAPLTGCQQVDNGLSHTISCGLSDFAPGTSGVLGAIFQVTAPSSNYSDFTVSISWYIGAGAIPDLDSSNNVRYVNFVFCGSQSTNPGCQTATPAGS